jgi:hypothetical protein
LQLITIRALLGETETSTRANGAIFPGAGIGALKESFTPSTFSETLLAPTAGIPIHIAIDSTP